MGQLHGVARRILINVQIDAEDSGQIVRPTGAEIVEAEGQNVVPGESEPQLKDVKNEDRSGNVYENKGPKDNLPDTKDDISAWLNANLHKNTHNSQDPTALLRLFEPFGTNPSPQ